MKALIIDDYEEVGNLLRSQLLRLGVDARAVARIDELRNAFNQEVPDIVFVDLSLGDTDAVDVFHVLRDLQFPGSLIVVSGHPETVLRHAHEVAARLGLNARGIMKKPFRQQDVETVLKELGRSRALNQGRPSQLPAEETLRLALDERWIEYWFQPKVDLRTEAVVGAECLARMRHPEKGVLLPGQFLHTAQASDLLQLTIDGAMAATEAASIISTDGQQLRFSVNISTRNMGDPDLLPSLKRIRDGAKHPIELVLEITESDLGADDFVCQSFATRAFLHGFKVSIDDFGCGYATFERLRHTPFSELKLDRSAVHGCANNRILKNICSATVQLAHGFDASAVAEGVETPEDAATLAGMGCDVAQGYLFAPALPRAEFVAYVRSRRKAQMR